MVFGRFNKFIARHGFLARLFLFVAMVGPLVLLYGVRGCRAQGPRQIASRVGTVYGQPVSRHAFFDQLRAISLGYLIEPDMFDPKARIVQQLAFSRGFNPGSGQLVRLLGGDALNRICALREAERLGINKVTDKELRTRLMAIPMFQKDGKFDPTRYKSFRDGQLQRMGISPNGFDAIIRDNVVVDRLEARVARTITVSAQEARLAYQQGNLSCEAQVARYRAFTYAKDIAVTEEEVKTYFDEHIKTYRIPDQVRLKVAVFDSTDFREKAAVTDQEVKDYYAANKRLEFTTKQVHTRHILIKSSPRMNKEQRDLKRKLAETILQSLKSGGDFAELAREHSEDLSSKNKGGDVGFISEGRMMRQYVQAAFALQDQAVSDVVDVPPVGFYIIQKLGQRDVIPLADAADRIRTAIRKRRDEAECRKQYDADKAEKYSVKQVRVRQIKKELQALDSDEFRAEKRRKLQALAEKARTGAPGAFGALARQNSDDKATAGKGGDLGFFSRNDKKYAAIADVAFKLKPNEISDVIESPDAYYIVQKVAEREEIPFDEVKKDLLADLRKKRREAAQASANEAAVQFSLRAFDKLESVAPSEKALAFAKLAAAEKVTVADSGYFDADDYSVPGIPGSTRFLARDGAGLSADNALSDVIQGYSFFYVACWRDTKPGSLPAFKEKREKKIPAADKPGEFTTTTEEVLTSQAKRAENDLKTEKARKQARDVARKDSETIRAALEKGTPFEEAIGEIHFTKLEPFPLLRGPARNVPDADTIKATAAKTPAGTLAPPAETDDGAVLVYVTAQKMPTAKEYDNIADAWRRWYRRTRQRAALQAYYKTLRDSAETKLGKDWQFLQEDEADNNKTG